MPYQFGLSTRAGTEGVQPRTTVLTLSFDALGCQRCSQARVFLPSSRILASSAPLFPACVACSATRSDRAQIQFNQGKTRVWNAAGEETSNLTALQLECSAAYMWVGARTLPPKRQGLVVLGAPHGTDCWTSAAAKMFSCSSSRPRRLAVDLLRMLPRISLRTIPAGMITQLPRVSALCSFGEEVPELSADALATVRIPLGLGGLGLHSAASGANAAERLAAGRTRPRDAPFSPRPCVPSAAVSQAGQRSCAHGLPYVSCCCLAALTAVCSYQRPGIMAGSIILSRKCWLQVRDA